MGHKLKWKLLIYDTIVYLLSAVLILIIYPRSVDHLTMELVIIHMITGYLCMYVFRL